MLPLVLLLCLHGATGGAGMLGSASYAAVPFPQAQRPAEQCFGEGLGVPGLETLIEDGILWAEGIPFLVTPEQPQALVMSLDEMQTQMVPVGAPAYRLFLLAATRVTDRDDLWTGFSPDSQFHVNIHYADGSEELIIPALYPSMAHWTSLPGSPWAELPHQPESTPW